MYSDDDEYNTPPSARSANLPPLGSGPTAAAQDPPRAMSSQSGRGAAKAAAEPRSASSVDNPRRCVNGRSPATLAPLSSARDGGGGGSRAELLRHNRALREELLALNGKLDEALAMRGQRVNFTAQLPPPAGRGRGAETPLERMAAKNDVSRKTNADMRRQLREMQDLDRASDVANEVCEQGARLRALRDEVRGQENVAAHQEQQLAVVRRAEAEMRELRAEQSGEVAAMKEEARAAREQRETEQRSFARVMHQVGRVDEKLKLQAEVGDGVRGVQDMQDQVEEKDRLIDSLQYQVAVLSKSNAAGDKKKRSAGKGGGKGGGKVSRELSRLREEADALRQRAGSADMADSLGVDVRV